MSFWLTLVALVMIAFVALWWTADELDLEKLSDVFVTVFYLLGVMEFILIIVTIIIKLFEG